MTKILQHTQKYIFANLTKKNQTNRYNFDSFTLDDYYFGCCHFFDNLSKGEEVSAPD